MALPWFRAAMLVTFGVSLLASRPLARVLRAHPLLGWWLIMSVGLVASATLTPLGEAIEFGARGSGTCDFGRLGLAPLHQLRTLNDTSLNVLLVVPLGTAVGLLRRSRAKWIVLGLAITLPFAIEAIQLLATVLDRACQSADVSDNLTGLALGVCLGSGIGVLAGRLPSRRHG